MISVYLAYPSFDDFSDQDMNRVHKHREAAKRWIEQRHGEVEFVTTPNQVNLNNPLERLGWSLITIAGCDIVYTPHGWGSDKECSAIFQCCQDYGIPWAELPRQFCDGFIFSYTAPDNYKLIRLPE